MISRAIQSFLLMIIICSHCSHCSSCSTLTSMQTARTVKKGKSSGYFALGFQGVRFTKKSSDSTENDLQTAIEKIRIPILEGGLRHGFGDSWV